MHRTRARQKGRTLIALSWAALLVYSAAVFWVSSLPLETLQSLGFSFSDKLVHLQVYALWGFLCSAALWATSPAISPGSLILWTMLAGTLYGLSDELHQMFVPGRAAELGDLAADTIGAALGAAVFVVLRGVFFRRRSPAAEETPE